MTIRNFTHPKFQPELNTKLTQIASAIQFLTDAGVLQTDGLTLPSGAANRVLATPDAVAGLATLRALVVADLPSLTSAQLRALLSDESGTGLAYFQGGALGTPASGVATNLTGTASGLTAGNVTTNANLTGPITSAGNATSIASQTGTGTKFVVDTAPTLQTSVTVPVVIGGSATTATLIFRPTSGNGAAGADMIFQVGNNGATEAMRILNSGNVGINNNAPASKLDVVVGNVDGLTVTSSNSGFIELAKSGANTRWRLANDYTAAGYLEFLVGLAGAAPATSVITVKNDGKVGIGMVPTVALDVTGVIKTSDRIRLKGFTVATLPAGTAGDTAYVTDALAPVFLGIIAGGGTVVTPVFHNGTNWVAQ